MLIALEVDNWFIKGTEFHASGAVVLGELVLATMGEQIIDKDTGEHGYYSVLPINRSEPT